jgi:CheY-like chemotaxis protein
MDAADLPPDPRRAAAPTPGFALVVEDDAAVRAVTTRMLERAGFQGTDASAQHGALCRRHRHALGRLVWI